VTTPQTTVPWYSWLAIWIFIGLYAALSERSHPRNPGAYVTIAATIVAGLIFHLVRGGEWRLAGVMVGMCGGHLGAKSGSIIQAMVGAVILGILIGLSIRLLDRVRGKIGAGSKPRPTQPADRAARAGAPGPWDGE